jgi:hypothetical protein
MSVGPPVLAEGSKAEASIHRVASSGRPGDGGRLPSCVRRPHP